MAITYPISLPTGLKYDRAFPMLGRSTSVSMYGKRAVSFIEYADPVWQIPIMVQNMTNAERQKLDAFISAARDGLKTVLYTPRSVCVPQAYWGDANNPLIAGTATLASVTGGNVITINGLATGTAGPELIVNPGFETGALTPWFPGTGVSVATGAGHGGTKYLLLDKGAAGIGAGTQRESLQIIDGIVAGSTYNYSAWLSSITGTSAAGAYLNLQWRNAANAVISTSNIVVNAGYGVAWSQVVGSAIAPPLATRVLTYAVLATSGALQTMALDDFSLKLNPQLKIMAGDLISLTSGASSLIVRALEDATASGGSITFTIEPYLPSYITVGATVRFKNPQMTTRLMPNTYQVGTGPFPSASFTLIEVPQ